MGNDFVRGARKRAGRSTPTYDAVLRLVRRCGFDLAEMLVERDHSDWRPAQDPANLRRLSDALRELDHDLVQDARATELHGVAVVVASLADIVRSKQAANRPKDQRVLPTLREILASPYDRSHETDSEPGFDAAPQSRTSTAQPWGPTVT